MSRVVIVDRVGAGDAGEPREVRYRLRYCNRFVRTGITYEATAASDGRRRVTVTGFSPDGEQVYVERNSSRRTQPMKTRTLVTRFAPVDQFGVARWRAPYELKRGNPG